MTTSIKIPKRSQKQPRHHPNSLSVEEASSSSSSSSSCESNYPNPQTPQQPSSSFSMSPSLSSTSPSSSPFPADKNPLPRASRPRHDRRPSLLSQLMSFLVVTYRDWRGREPLSKIKSRLTPRTCLFPTGSSLSAQVHTVINVGHPDGPPRLVCHLGFDMYCYFLVHSIPGTSRDAFHPPTSQPRSPKVH